MMSDVDRLPLPELRAEMRRLHARIARQDRELGTLRRRVQTLEQANRRLHLELHPAGRTVDASHLSVIHGGHGGEFDEDAEPRVVCRSMEVVTLPPDPFDADGDVHCDGCGVDWSTRAETGGAIFAGNAVGPCCESNLEMILTAGSTSLATFISCPSGKSFADFVRDYRRAGAAFDVHLPEIGHV